MQDSIKDTTIEEVPSLEETKEDIGNEVTITEDMSVSRKDEKESGRRKKTKFWKGFFIGILLTLVIVGVAGFLVIRAFLSGNLSLSPSFGQTVELEDGVDNTDGLDYDRILNKIQTLQFIISNYFLFDEDVTKVEDGIYAGLMEGLDDPYSVYYTAQEFEALNEETEGTYSGIGAVVNQNAETKVITIVRVFDGTPAQEAGLLAGDILYKVDGMEVTGMDLDLVVRSYIRGLEGTTLELVVLRGDDREEIVLNVTRRSIEVPTVESKMLEDGIGYVMVSQFDALTSTQFISAIESLQAEGMNKMIIDLRGNPGGLLDQVVEMMDYILPDELLVYTADKNGNGDKYYGEDGHELKIPMVVLVNGDSASASEVFTATFKDFNWGTVFGTTTFGKGIVQNILPLTDGTAIKITTQHYYPPSGYDLHGIGVDPDVVVEMDKGGVMGEESDNQLQAAIDYLKE